MSEPKTIADGIQFLAEDLVHWTLADDRLGGFRSDSYAVRTVSGWVMIDPLPLNPRALESIQPVCGIFLTHGWHQRSAWRYRHELSAPVYASEAARGMDEDPDEMYSVDKMPVPGFTGVPSEAMKTVYHLIFNTDSGPLKDKPVLFCADLITQYPEQPYRFPVQPEFFDPVKGVEEIAILLQYYPEIMCPAHGKPLLEECQSILKNVAQQTELP